MTKCLPVLRPGMKNRFEKEAEAVNQAVKTVGVEVLAAHLDKSPRTVRTEMVPSKSPDSPHKLGYDDALSAMYLSDDITSLVIFLDRLGYVVVPAEGNNGRTSRELQSLKIMAIASRFNQWLAEALEDGSITDDEWVGGTELLKLLERDTATATRGDLHQPERLLARGPHGRGRGQED